ncbi:MAG: 3'-5' exonuclease, partial [Candidatus Margulisiibacteriota bacterium]
KIAYLHEQFNVPIQNILAVTFTNKAAREMLHRVGTLIGVPLENHRHHWILTFHALAFKILQMNATHLGYQSGFVVFDTGDQQSLVKRIMNAMNIDLKMTKPGSVQSAISQAKNNLVTPESYHVDSQFKGNVAKVYAEYQLQLFKNNAMDFDDLLLNMLKLFREHSAILEHYQDQFQFVLIDEYQDINLPQYLVAHLLSQKHKRLFVVGDTDQNIYSWRGASLQNILNFEKDFPDAKVVVLEQNYRSTQTILTIANSVIENNKQRKKKTLWTDNGAGKKAICYIAHNEYDEGEFIARTMQALISEGISPNEIAVLYRTNSMSRVIEEVLQQYNIKYRVYGGFRFYERKEIKDILSYLRLVNNDQDDLAVSRIINVPSRKIGKVTMERLMSKAQSENKSLMTVIREESSPQLKLFYSLIDELRGLLQDQKMNLPDLIAQIVEKTGYERWLKEEDASEVLSRLENIQELIASTHSAQYSLEEFLALSALLTQQDEPASDEPVVTLMTLHSAKGLEYDVVFLGGLEEKMLPHSQSMNVAEELEEERRLCYVGITRARKQLFMSAASYRTSFYEDSRAQDLSRFFYEMPNNQITIDLSKKLSPFNHILAVLKQDDTRVLKEKHSGRFLTSKPQDEDKIIYEYNIGDQVLSPTFGQGEVMQTIGQGKGISLQIRFGTDTKLIMPKYGKLEKVVAT